MLRILLFVMAVLSRAQGKHTNWQPLWRALVGSVHHLQGTTMRFPASLLLITVLLLPLIEAFSFLISVIRACSVKLGGIH
jgi:hypothetical protein